MNKQGTDQSASPQPLYDCIIIGASPGGLQAAIYLGRANRKVLLLDRGGGRTSHARSIENFLTQKAITGKELIERGLEQARSFGVAVEKTVVTLLRKDHEFTASAGEREFRGRFVIVGTGITDILPSLGNLAPFFGVSFFTCIDCDGYKTAGKQVVVMGNSIEAVRLAFAVRELYTDRVGLVLTGFSPPPGHEELLAESGIALFRGTPSRIIGSGGMEAVELEDGTRIPAEAVLSNFGFTMNDRFLQGLDLDRSANGSIVVNRQYESSVPGLYVVGPLNTGHDQAVIAAGQGAVSAIDINKRLFEF